MTQAPAPKPPLNEQIADIVLKVIMTGGVAGGGVGAFWSLLKNSDVPKAIASVVIGIGIAYGAKLLMPVHQGNQRRLEQAGKAMDSGLDWVTDQAIAAATRFEDKYLLCQASECQALRSEGVAQREGIFVPLLKEVFVPLGLDFSAMEPGYRTLPEAWRQAEADKHLTVWDFLAKMRESANFRQLVILAWGGYGKTTLLKHIAFRYGIKQPLKSAPSLVPFLLVLRQYRDLLSQAEPPSLAELITQHHLPQLAGAQNLRPPASWAESILQRGQAIVMLDGFDEVAKSQRPAVARWINQQVQQYGQSVFIVTSRPKAYKEQAADSRLNLATPLWVQDFNANQRQSFVEKWYQCQERYANVGRDTPDVRKVAAQSAKDLLDQIETRQDLKDLAKNPLLLNLIVTFHRQFPGAELPKHRVELYREICTLQLRDRPRARRIDTVLTQCDPLPVLQQLALIMMQQRWERIRRATLLKGLKQLLERQEDAVAPDRFLEDVVQISEILVQQEDEYEFAHLSFQEYLAAAYIAQRKLEREKELYQHLDDDWWKPTILLYSAQVNPTRLIRQAMTHGALDLAYACLQETTKRVDADLRAEIQSVAEQVQNERYRTLESYLQAGQWRKADKETYRLMITTVGKEEGQFFDPEDLLNFPCEDLKTIDELWVKYSQGKFGFSVQKQIYVDCGAALDGKYPGDKIWDEFCDRIGWQRQGNYVNYKDLKANPKISPSGEFPFVGVFGRSFLFPFPERAVGSFVVSSLAQRLVNFSK